MTRFAFGSMSSPLYKNFAPTLVKAHWPSASPQPPPITHILSTLTNEISDFPENFSIVFDDYHLIKSQPIHEALTFLLDHLPAQMHMILTTRADPPLPLARLRARNQLTELRADDLRFTQRSGSFLNEVMGLKLSADDILTLESRTEGWIAGLQLAALSMQGRDDVAGFIQAFSGSHRHVLTYLAEEVLEQRPEGTLNFLLQTSILDRLCGPLCDAVDGRNESQTLYRNSSKPICSLCRSMTREVVSLSSFICRGIARPFATDSTQLNAGMHRRASAWYEQNELMAEAVNHALVAQAFERAAMLVEQVAPAMIQRGELARLLTWLNTLPDDEIQARPRLALYYGWGLLLSGEIRAGRSPPGSHRGRAGKG